MNNYIQSANTYISDHKKQFTLGAVIALATIVILTLVALFIYNDPSSKIVYQPVKACDLLTPSKAQALLGEHMVGVDKNAPTITDNVATSKCSYGDGNIDANQVIVAAVAVRTGINDDGVKQNKNEFNAKKPGDHAVDVKDVGEKAYFNNENGQLNILDGRDWLILSYGIGNAPEANTVEKAVELAKVVLQQ
ncbi:MAG: hypothetical protein WC426_14150 [Sulfuriferula sp.]